MTAGKIVRKRRMPDRKTGRISTRMNIMIAGMMITMIFWQVPLLVA